MYRLKVKGWKKILQANENQKKAGVTKLIPDKIDVKSKSVTRDKGQYIVRKGSLHEEDTLVNISSCNIGVPRHVNINRIEGGKWTTIQQ